MPSFVKQLRGEFDGNSAIPQAFCRAALFSTQRYPYYHPLVTVLNICLQIILLCSSIQIVLYHVKKKKYKDNYCIKEKEYKVCQSPF